MIRGGGKNLDILLSNMHRVVKTKRGGVHSKA
jgi:hypothetical protein